MVLRAFPIDILFPNVYNTLNPPLSITIIYNTTTASFLRQLYNAGSTLVLAGRQCVHLASIVSVMHVPNSLLYELTIPFTDFLT